MRTFTLIVAACGVILSVTWSSFAAVPSLRPEELKKNGSHIVLGRVEAVYSVEKSGRPDMADRHYVIELVVTAVEKGDGLNERQVVYGKCWKPSKRPERWTGSQGQNEVPEAGAEGRLYLKQGKDGTFTLLVPNGWEATKK
jgi:hypothetical protein